MLSIANEVDLLFFHYLCFVCDTNYIFSTIRVLRTKLFLFLSLFNLNANAQNIFSLGEFLHNFFFHEWWIINIYITE